MVGGKMTPAVCKPHFHFHNQHRKRRCFPQLLSLGNNGTSGVTVENDEADKEGKEVCLNIIF